MGFTLAVQFHAALGTPRSDASLTTITVDYPLEGSIFPPDFAAPTFLWREESQKPVHWRIDVALAKGSPVRSESDGEPIQVGEIDPRCVAPTNELPQLTSAQAAAHTWQPDEQKWSAIKKRAAGCAVTVTITGYLDDQRKQPVSHGQVTLQISKDPVGAPIFYRDVPLMPNEDNKVVTPLAGARWVSSSGGWTGR